MEERINKIELDLALMAKTQQTMSEALSKISISLDKYLLSTTEIRIVQQRVEYIDKEAIESFKRVYDRIEKIENILSKLTWLIITPLVLGLLGIIVSKGV